MFDLTGPECVSSLVFIVWPDHSQYQYLHGMNLSYNEWWSIQCQIHVAFSQAYCTIRTLSVKKIWWWKNSLQPPAHPEPHTHTWSLALEAEMWLKIRSKRASLGSPCTLAWIEAFSAPDYIQSDPRGRNVHKKWGRRQESIFPLIWYNVSARFWKTTYTFIILSNNIT